MEQNAAFFGGCVFGILAKVYTKRLTQSRNRWLLDDGVSVHYLAPLLFQGPAGLGLGDQAVCIVLSKVPPTHQSAASRTFVGPVAFRDGLTALMEKRPHIVDPQLRLFERREMTAMGHVRPARDVVARFRDAAGRPGRAAVVTSVELRAPGGDVHFGWLQRLMPAFVIIPRR